MAELHNRISFDEFSENLARIFAHVISEGETIVVEKAAGELVEVKPIARTTSQRRVKTQEDYEAFLASAGSWQDVDVEAFLKDNEESRNLSTRPPVAL